MTTLIKVIKYEGHNWKVCGDLKVVGLLLGLHGGYTKHCCFVYGTVELGKTIKLRKSGVCNEYIANNVNVKHISLIDPKHVILLPSHINPSFNENMLTKMDLLLNI